MLKSSKQKVCWCCTHVTSVTASNSIQSDNTKRITRQVSQTPDKEKRAVMAQSQLEKQLQRPLYGMPYHYSHPIYINPLTCDSLRPTRRALVHLAAQLAITFILHTSRPCARDNLFHRPGRRLTRRACKRNIMQPLRPHISYSARSKRTCAL
jgi:hypothetical protein